MKKTLLIGNFGAGNIGDELILSSALENYPNSIVMTNDGESSSQFVEKKIETVPFFPTGIRSAIRFLFSSSYRKKLFNLRNQIDQVIFPGGGLFAIRFRACFLWWLVFLWTQKTLKDARISFEHQGIDQKLGWGSRILTRYVLSRVGNISVRDEASQIAVKQLIGKNVQNQGDRVSRFLSSHFPQRNFQKENLILINSLSEWSFSHIQKKLIEKQIFHSNNEIEYIFIAFQKSDTQHVPEDFPGKVAFPQTQTQLFNLFQKASFVIGERFHSILLGEFFCGAERTFTLRKPYSEKVWSFMKHKNIESL